jgi:hypothetical protein
MDTVVGPYACILRMGLVGSSGHVFASVHCGMLSEVGAHEQVLGEYLTVLHDTLSNSSASMPYYVTHSYAHRCELFVACMNVSSIRSDVAVVAARYVL